MRELRFEKEVKDSKIIEKLKREKMDRKNVMKEERLGKEEVVKKQKLEKKVAKMRMKAQSLKGKFSTAGGKEGKRNQEQVGVILVGSSSEKKEQKVEAINEEGIKENPIVMAKHEPVAEIRGEDFGGSTFENPIVMAKHEPVAEIR